MIFNFILSNHHETSLNSMGDLLEPIYHGLTELGHHVIRYNRNFLTAPRVNVLTEFFVADQFVDEILLMKKERGDNFIFGILCTEDPEDNLVMSHYANRRPNLERLLAAADFAWPLLPVPGYYASHIDPVRVATLHYGYSEPYLHPRIVTDPRQRDVDVILYGNENPYRGRVTATLRKMGLTCFSSQREGYPGFVTEDIICRSKALLDIRRGPGVRFLSPTRIVKGLHCGTAVISERFDSCEIATLYDYTEACALEEMAERCAALVRSGAFVDRGLAALARFRKETSMRDNVARVLELPVFSALKRAESAPR